MADTECTETASSPEVELVSTECETLAVEPPKPKEESIKSFRKQFVAFCNFGNHSKVEKKTLTDKNLTKMFKDCKLYGKGLTTTDTDIAFNKVKEKGKR